MQRSTPFCKTASPSPKLVVVHINFMTYHLARLQAVQKHLDGECVGIELVGGYGDADYHGLPFRDPDRAGLNIVTLFSDRNLNQIPLPWLTWKLIQTLQRLDPDCIALCGYHRLENLMVLAWAKLTGRSTVLMCESKFDDKPRFVLRESVKRQLVKQFDGYLVGGASHRQYMLSLGAIPDRVFEGYDAVDNHLFATAAVDAHQNAKLLRAQWELPDRYFMVTCRFVGKKNLMMLLKAYQIYRQISDSNWSLVICGGGALEAKLRHLIKAEQIPDVVFPGFHKGKELGMYYGLASCFIHASIQEQWGLVVNEAMAAGLPVLVSRTCGCVSSLVQEGVNGFTFNPNQPGELARLMEQVTQDPIGLEAMGQASQAIVERYAPTVFAENMVRAMRSGFIRSRLRVHFY
jgi:1,2-diacylglycerol 3-alpha-glucosyltransferase